jgi:cell division protein FtsL
MPMGRVNLFLLRNILLTGFTTLNILLLILSILVSAMNPIQARFKAFFDSL